MSVPTPLNPLAPPGPSYARTVLSVLVLALLYLWIFPYHGTINNPNENVRVYMTVAIVDDHTFAINRIERDWGYTNDKATRLGKLYSSKAPGSSYVGVPGYWLLTHITGRDSHPLTPVQLAAHHKPPLDRTTVVYWLRLWSNVLPALVFAWFWHRFLGRRTTVAALREAVFFSTMVGSLLFAYSEMFASHAQNAFACMGALMALATMRERDVIARVEGREPARTSGLAFTAGLLGASATMFEYPAAIGTFGVVLLLLATASEKRWWAAISAPVWIIVGGVLYLKGVKVAGAVVGVLGVAAYGATLSTRSLARLGMAAAGAALPTLLTLWFHKRCFGSPFTPGYSFLENPEFHGATSQGFFGATSFSWEAAARLWFDPAFGMISTTAVLLFAAPGFGAMFSFGPMPRWARWTLRTLAGVALAFTLYKLGHAMLAVHGGDWHALPLEQLHWLAWIALAVVALGAVTLPPAPRRDAALAATMLLICDVLSRLIGTMNNWRGGWVVGPRYLATLVPMLGVAALAGLDAFAQGSVVRRRIATVFAAAATVEAIVLSGIPSAFFPHVPTEYGSPVFELFLPLIRRGYVPFNAGRYFWHWEGLKGLWPWAAAAAIVVLMVLGGDEKKFVNVCSHALASMALCLLILTPFAVLAHYDRMDVTRWVRSVWEPQPAGSAMTPVPPVRPGVQPVQPPAVTPEQLRARGRQLAEANDPNGALDAYRRALGARRP